jgi:toxin YoeB
VKPLTFTGNSWRQYQNLIEHDKVSLRKINKLLEDIDRNGEDKGIGHPEPLKYEYSGWWSREIDKKNRLIYRVPGETIELYEVGTHYGDK